MLSPIFPEVQYVTVTTEYNTKSGNPMFFHSFRGETTEHIIFKSMKLQTFSMTLRAKETATHI